MNNDIMKYESTLPEDFDGIFKFTNWSDEDFTGIWNKKQYTFPAQTTSPMLIPEHSPLEIQNIRKKFAMDLAQRELGNTPEYKAMTAQEGTPGNRTMNSIHMAASYSIDQLAPYIQKALMPLESGRVSVKPVPAVPLETKLSTNEDGEINTAAVKGDRDIENLAKGKSLAEKAGI